MKIYFRELKANYKSLLIYIGIVGFFVLVGFSKFAGYVENPEIIEVLNGMPQVILESFNMHAFNLTTVEGFFGVMYAFQALILGIAAVMWGSDIITKEERDRTVEFTLTMPIKRSTLVSAKILATLTYCLLLALAAWSFNAISALRYSPGEDFFRFLTQGMISLVILQLIFMAVGIFLGSALKRHKIAGSAAISILLGTYFFSVISGLREEWDFLKYFTPFKYFDPSLILHESRVEPVFIWLSFGIVLVCLTGAYITYHRKDLYI
jgi:ABC-2 type transport system permease protein